MSKLKKKYDLTKPTDVQELIDLVENGDLSEVDEIGCEEGYEDEDLIDLPASSDVISRPGADEIPRREEIHSMQRQESDDDNVSENEELPVEEEHPTGESPNKKKKAEWKREIIHRPPNFTWEDLQPHSENNDPVLSPL